MKIVEQIKEKLDIVEVIGSYIKIEKAGKNYKARCPFHNEKTPSFFISSERQNFYCFGCQAKGDVISFVEKIEGLDFKGAIHNLAERANIEINRDNFLRETTQVLDHKELLFEVMEKATLFFESELEREPSVIQYLHSRGLEDKTIKKWRLGFAQNDWRNLANKIMSPTYTKEILLDAGLIKTALNDTSKLYDTFRGRIMFPIRDSAKRVIAFSGRIFKEEPNAPKYLNSPETVLFKKSDVLYGWDMARDAIRRNNYAVLVEGQLDILLSHQAHITNTVASSGTALTENHLRKIKAISDRIIIAYDGDEAGYQAAKKAAQIALSLDMEVKIAPLPEGEDPASIVKKDPEEWRLILRNAKPVIEFALDQTQNKSKGISLIREVEKKVLPYLTYVKSEIEKAHFIRLISEKLNVSEDSLLKSLSKIKIEQFNPQSKMEVGTTVRNPKRILAGMIFSNLTSDLRERATSQLGEELVQSILEEFENNKDTLSFEIENLIPTERIKLMENEILKRVEYEEVQKQLWEFTKLLDTADQKTEEDLKQKIAKLTKRAEEFNKKDDLHI